MIIPPKKDAPYSRNPEGLTRVSFAFWGSPVYADSDGTLSCPGYSGLPWSDNQWDYVDIAGKKTPGVCQVVPAKGRDLDRKKGAGTDGETLTFNGLRCAEVEIQIAIWTAEQLRQLALLWSEISPKQGKGTPKAYDCSHPSFGMFHGVKSLVFYDAMGPVVGPFPGSRLFTIHAVEFIAKKKGKNATVTATESVGSAYDPQVFTYPTPGSNPKNVGPP